MYLFFDTETNGLPKHYGSPASDLNNWPRIIQLAFILTDENGRILEEYCNLIKPENWIIPNEKFWIDNGYSTEESMLFGIPIYKALRRYQEALKKAKVKIAHNITFDNPVIEAEMIREGIETALHKFKPGFCTMKNTTNIVCAKHANGYSNKWPKLIELHEFLFGEEFDGAHDALADVKATAKCFFELKKRKLINV
jgi:DNA polymerase III epsilon subunit-like protein